METRIDRQQAKLDAKASMRQHRPSVYLVALVYLVIGYILTLLSTRLMYPQAELQTLLQATTDAELYRALLAMEQPGVAAQFLYFAIQIMEIMLGVGFVSFCLNVARGAAAGFGSLFDAFGNFIRMLWLNILIGIFVFLWSLLLFIPGIIAAYRYSMAVFILLDDPDKGALQCIRESKEMTRGHKWELFVLDLSFFGWYLLTLIPIVLIYVHPYVTVTKANYYRILSGRPDAPEHVDIAV